MLNPWLIIGVMTSLIIVGGAGYAMGLKIERAACNSAKQETINDNISIREEQDNATRSSDAAYINSLRRGTF